MGEQGEGGNGAHEPKLDLPFFNRRKTRDERPTLEVVGDDPTAEEPPLHLSPEDLAAREAAIAEALATDREARAARRRKRAPKAAKEPPPAKASRRPTASSAEQDPAAPSARQDPAASAPKQKPAKQPKPRREKQPKRPRRLPVLPRLAEPLATIVTGAICGLATVALANGFSRGCQAIRGVASCGSLGIVALLLMLGANVVLGAILLGALRVRESTSIAFVATGFTAAVVVVFLGSHFGAAWMAIAMPAVTAAIYFASWRAWSAIRATDG